MKTLQLTKTKSAALALFGAISFAAVSTGQAAFAPLPSNTAETPGVSLTSTNGLTGLVIASQDSFFQESGTPGPAFSGTLRSLVVQQPGGNLDFYYQVINSSAPFSQALNQDIYRVKTTGGFIPTSISATATYRTDGLSGLTGVVPAFVNGTVPPLTADRDVNTSGSLGFDFVNDPNPQNRFIVDLMGNPFASNVSPGETSNFLVIRTNATTFGLISTVVSGDGSAFTSAFAPVPEPGTVLFGLAVLGVCASRTYNRRRQSLEA